MAACVTYLRISAYSYPALAVYNDGAALCRTEARAVNRKIKTVLNWFTSETPETADSPA